MKKGSNSTSSESWIRTSTTTFRVSRPTVRRSRSTFPRNRTLPNCFEDSHASTTLERQNMNWEFGGRNSEVFLYRTFRPPTSDLQLIQSGTPESNREPQASKAHVLPSAPVPVICIEFGATDSNRLNLLQRQTACACGTPSQSTESWNRTNGSLSNNQTETPTSPLRFVAMGNSECGIPQSTFRILFSCTGEIRTHRHRFLRPAAQAVGVPHSFKFGIGKSEVGISSAKLALPISDLPIPIWKKRPIPDSNR